MRITSQGNPTIQTVSTPVVAKQSEQVNAVAKDVVKQSIVQENDLKKEPKTKEKLQEAITAINDFLELEKKSSKFVLHDGLDKYYVRLVDPETEEVIKEIPPESLLNAFYEMKKLAGMIVDKKI